MYKRTISQLVATDNSRWVLALLFAVTLHALIFVFWTSSGNEQGAVFGNEGVHVGLSLASISEASQASNLFEDPPLDDLPTELPQPIFEVVPVAPMELKDQYPNEIPTPNLEPLFDQVNSLKIANLETPRAVLDFKPTQPFQSSTEKQASGPGNSNQAGSSDRVSNSYVARVAAHLNRFKKYPKTSRRAKEEGKVNVQFTVDIDGNVSAIRLTQSSGFVELDEESLRMVRRAAPFPEIPNALRKRGIQEFQIRSSISFSLTE